MYAYKSLALLFYFVILGEILSVSDAFKSFRPYKYYNRRPSHRLKWHPGSRPPTWRPPRKRPPPRYYPYYKQKFHRYPSHYENNVDYPTDEQPYTIEIELPRRYGATGKYHRHIYNQRGFNKGEVYDEPEYDEYGEDEYPDERDKVIRTRKKRIRIKAVKGLKPKLNIRISRLDDEKAFETEVRPLLEPQMSTNPQKLETQFGEEWVPANPKPSYPAYLRGA